MAATGKSSVDAPRNFQGFIAVVTSAACEWFLIFILLVDALLSYLLTKFADYCDLQSPCIVCSRFEHITGNESSQLYEELLCSNHISKLASWIGSQHFGKDDDNEDYFFPFTTRDYSNRDMHMFSYGNSVSDIESSGPRRRAVVRSCGHSPARSPMHSPSRSFVDADQWSDSSSPGGRRGNPKGVKLKPSGRKHPKPNIPLPRLPNRSRSKEQDNSKKIRDKSPASVSSRQSAKVGVDPLSQGYSELVLFTDTESESLFTDGDDGSYLSSASHEPKMERPKRATRYRHKPPPNGFKSRRHRNQSSKPKRSLSEPWPVFTKSSDVKYIGSDNEFETGIRDPYYQQSNPKSNLSALPELISLDDVFSSTSVQEKVINETGDFGNASSNKHVELVTSVFAKEGASDKNDPTLSKSDHSNVNGMCESKGSAREMDSSGITAEARLIKSIPSDVDNATKLQGSIQERDSSGITTEAPISTNQNAMSTSAGSDKERVSSGITSEECRSTKRNNLKAMSDTMKLLVQQDSSAPEIKLPPRSTGSTVDGSVSEKQTADASISIAKPTLHSSVSVDSGLESLDADYVSEIEGESIVDQLKRQIAHDRKCIKELYKELEEERNAAGIAANQAMAMITKLQEEKAAFQMEALHYLRMMEEQAEFDVEELEKANDLLAEKEKEIQDLEAELEFSKVPDEPMTETVINRTSDVVGNIDQVESTITPGVNDDVAATCNSMDTKVPIVGNQPLFSETTLLEFDDEKLYITNCLKSLERRLSEIYSRGASSKMLNGNENQPESRTKDSKEKSILIDGQNQEETPMTERGELHRQLEENVLHEQKDPHMSNGGPAAEERQTDCDDGGNIECKEAVIDSVSHGEKNIMDSRDMDMVTLENEIADLNDRLEALETDHDFLEHMVYSLENGAEGLKFVREVAYQLQELRKIGRHVR